MNRVKYAVEQANKKLEGATKHELRIMLGDYMRIIEEQREFPHYDLYKLTNASIMCTMINDKLNG